jgi:hypothetical protein
VYSYGGPLGFGKVSYSLVTSVPEPGTAGLFAIALIAGVVSLRIRPRGGTKLG